MLDVGPDLMQYLIKLPIKQKERNPGDVDTFQFIVIVVNQCKGVKYKSLNYHWLLL